jgi:hypothetical protein
MNGGTNSTIGPNIGSFYKHLVSYIHFSSSVEGLFAFVLTMRALSIISPFEQEGDDIYVLSIISPF